ncbi:MAG: class I SAM-dependent methyltransferase [Alphaproteobacteria bacterium]|nr:class I SAM-dependent methyltransferase [Alphaproteobacteria bacterium]
MSDQVHSDRIHRDGASFRDPAGHIYQKDGRILRSVTETGAENYEYVRDSGFLPALIADDRVIGMAEVPPDTLDGVLDCRYVLEHPALPFISYPYEWCFSALRAAALLQLELITEALNRDVMLSDASAYNVQFRGADPVYIDALSFRPYRDGEYWSAHQQFCNQFLNPLLLTALGRVGFNAWFRGNLEGIGSADLAHLLPWYRKLSWRVMTHVTLPVNFQAGSRQKTAARLDTAKARRLPKASLIHLVNGLHRWIAGLSPPSAQGSTWRDYESDNSYDAEATGLKQAFTSRFAATVKPSVLWDVGCNTGFYAETALQAGAGSVIGFDTDVGAVEAAFARARENQLAFLPLVLDAADPSPGQGWRGRERRSLQDRANADGLIAYAIVHHLSIGRNIPLAAVVEWLIELAPQGVIEFVEKEDPMVRHMLRLRDDIFGDYHRDAFMAAIREHAEIVDTSDVIEGRRVLVWYRRRAS